MNITLRLVMTTVLLVITVQIFAQIEKEINNNEVEGLYLNLSDFKSDKLTRPIDKQHEGDKIKLKQFFISPEIISVEQDKETVFYKDSIFAIRLTNSENYRFINLTPCLIADTSYLYIYTYKTTKTGYKQSGPYRRAKEIPVTYYYFSTGNHKNFYMLTLENLHKYVLSDPFIDNAVSNEFTSDEMLTQINSKTGYFELNVAILSILKK